MPMIVLALSASGPSRAARLCHDLKGLYTPCPPATGPARPSRLGDTRGTTTPEPVAGQMPTTVAAHGKSVPIVARAKHCHDLKGLYTPCVR